MTTAASAESKAGRDKDDLREREGIARFNAIMKVVNRRLRFVRCHRTHSGRALDFTDRPYLKELVEDRLLGEDIMKCVQNGVTEMALLLELAAAAEGWSVMVVLPTEVERDRFVRNRIDRPVTFVPEYQALRKASPREIDNVGFKEFGGGILNSVTAGTEVSFKEIPIDLLVVEEFDACDAHLLEMAGDRLTNSDFGIRYNIANPTYTDTGIHKLYKVGTQRQWHIKCGSCGDGQPLEWFENVVTTKHDAAGQVEGYELRDAEWTPESGRDITCYCRKCGAELDRYESHPDRAFWKDTNPGARRRSRHFSALYQHNISLAKLWREFKAGLDSQASMETFYRSRLGLPYSAPGSKLTEEVLERCVTDYLAPDAGSYTVFGLDVGARFDLQVWQAGFKEGHPWQKLLYADKLDTLEAVERVLQRYGCIIGVADARPETHLLIKFQRELLKYRPDATSLAEGPLWRCDFQETIREYSLDEEQGIVKVDRTSILDASAEGFVKGWRELPRGASGLIGGAFYEELMEPERVRKVSPSGRERRVWEGKKDHQFLVAAYAWLAALMSGFFQPVVDVREVVTEPKVEGELALTMPE